MTTPNTARSLGALAAMLAWLWATSMAALAQPADVDDGEGPQSSFAELDRYGRWIEHPEWGTVWSPDVDDDWRPYTVGRWVSTQEHGWYWDSDEPFGWAVYHYGRWLDDDEEGWIWVPGTEWGPAWVAWRYGEDAVGWAPLPPRAVWDRERGVIIDDDFYHSPRFSPLWIFVAPRHLMMPVLHRHAYPHARSAAFFARTRPATRYGWEGRRIFNHGPGIREIERLTRAPVPSVRLAFSPRPVLRTRRAFGEPVAVFRPSIAPSERWRAGRSGDWRRFEPGRPERARQERGFAPPRGDGAGGESRRFDRDTQPPRFDRGDRFRDERPSRNDWSRGARERPDAAPPPRTEPVPRGAPLQQVPQAGDRPRRDFDSDRFGGRSREGSSRDLGSREGGSRSNRDESRGRPFQGPTTPPTATPLPRAEPPRRGDEPPRESRRGPGGMGSPDGERPREAAQPPRPRPEQQGQPQPRKGDDPPQPFEGRRGPRG